MTLLEALEDIGKGRIIDNGCDYELIALAKGTYTFTIGWVDDYFTITLTGKQGENAQEMQRAFYNYVETHYKEYNCIHKAEYRRLKK